MTRSMYGTAPSSPPSLSLWLGRFSDEAMWTPIPTFELTTLLLQEWHRTTLAETYETLRTDAWTGAALFARLSRSWREAADAWRSVQSEVILESPDAVSRVKSEPHHNACQLS